MRSGDPATVTDRDGRAPPEVMNATDTPYSRGLPPFLGGYARAVVSPARFASGTAGGAPAGGRPLALAAWDAATSLA